ncbi:MAG: hypothetical protein L6406_05780 [Desulfobacterales bacterium]|nr:hypothetical protein [Desulfobacterales bacterium]
MTTDFLSVTEIAGDEVTQEQGRPQLNKGKSRLNPSTIVNYLRGTALRHLRQAG